MILLGVESEIIIAGSGLLAGMKVELSTAFTPTDGGPNANAGFSARTVRTDGTVRFQVATDEITPDNKPGRVRAWLRPAGSPFNADPVGPDAVIEFPIPLTL